MTMAEDRFGIDLGPAGDSAEADAEEAVTAAPLKPPAKTLTERLASAAADRDQTDTPVR